jgi:hypothetical protein
MCFFHFESSACNLFTFGLLQVPVSEETLLTPHVWNGVSVQLNRALLSAGGDHFTGGSMKRMALGVLLLLTALNSSPRIAVAAGQVGVGKVGTIAVNTSGWVSFHLQGFPQLCDSGAGGENKWAQMTTNYMNLDQIRQILAVLTAAKLASRDVVVYGADNEDNRQPPEWSCRVFQVALQ